jgi:hypothetical protein
LLPFDNGVFAQPVTANPAARQIENATVSMAMRGVIGTSSSKRSRASPLDALGGESCPHLGSSGNL